MSVDLLTPILDEGVRHSNFFEGRLLSGRDLREEQDANRRNRWQLGKGIGSGIIDGMFVSVDNDGSDGATPLVTVTSGLALNRLGQALEILNDLQIRLDREPPVISPNAGAFKDCDEVLNTLTPTNDGIYILVASPASGYLESAPKSGLQSNGKIIDCGKRYAVDGIRFRLERLNASELSGISDDTRNLIDLELIPSEDVADRSRLRNLIAHLCFGTETLVNYPIDLLARNGNRPTFEAYGAIDDLRALEVLTDCDVPLGLFHWSSGGIAFIDLWSVRRRVVPPVSVNDAPTVFGARQRSEGEASLHQFQAHLTDLISAVTNPGRIRAQDYFRYLPAAGFYSLGARGLTGAAADDSFFAGKPTRGPEYMDGARIRSLVEQSFVQPAIDLENTEMTWLYKPWQNRRSVDFGNDVEPYVIFASPHIPYAATAKFDVSRWEFSNYAKAGNAGI